MFICITCRPLTVVSVIVSWEQAISRRVEVRRREVRRLEVRRLGVRGFMGKWLAGR
jgi:hypothetical protein